MKIKINYFGQLRQIAGAEDETFQLDDNPSLKDILIAASSNYPETFKNIILDEAGSPRPSAVILLNGETIDKDNEPSFKDGDEISILTAIAGG